MAAAVSTEVERPQLDKERERERGRTNATRRGQGGRGGREGSNQCRSPWQPRAASAMPADLPLPIHPGPSCEWRERIPQPPSASAAWRVPSRALASGLFVILVNARAASAQAPNTYEPTREQRAAPRSASCESSAHPSCWLATCGHPRTDRGSGGSEKCIHANNVSA